MHLRIALFVLPLVVACRPEQSSTPATTRPAVDAHAQPSPSIPAGHGVLVRPGATVWIDAARKQPLALPEDLVGGGVQLRVIADRGETLEVDVETAAACTSPVVGDFALRLFVARADLRDATSSVLETTLADGKRVIVQPGAPVDGAPGARTVAIALRDGRASIEAPDAVVAKHFVVGEQDFACVDVLENGQSVAAPIAGAVGPIDTTGRLRYVFPSSKVYWQSGDEAGKSVFLHAFAAESAIAGARTCFPLPLGEGNVTTLCFDSKDAVDGNDLLGVDASDNRPRMTPATAEVKGALDKDVIRRVVRAHINEVSNCYNAALQDDADEKGRVTVQFAIGGEGRVVAARVVDSSTTSTELPKCIAKAVQRWFFPKPEGGGNVIVTYPFLLEPG